MMDAKHCRGCYDDFYNGGEGRVCWSRERAKVIWRKEVSIDQRPPWTQKSRRLPSCYSRQRYIYVKPEQVR